MPPDVTCPSCMACKRAACVFGGVRLISSAKIILENIITFVNQSILCEFHEFSKKEYIKFKENIDFTERIFHGERRQIKICAG